MSAAGGLRATLASAAEELEYHWLPDPYRHPYTDRRTRGQRAQERLDLLLFGTTPTSRGIGAALCCAGAVVADAAGGWRSLALGLAALALAGGAVLAFAKLAQSHTSLAWRDFPRYALLAPLAWFARYVLGFALGMLVPHSPWLPAALGMLVLALGYAVERVLAERVWRWMAWDYWEHKVDSRWRARALERERKRQQRCNHELGAGMSVRNYGYGSADGHPPGPECFGFSKCKKCGKEWY